MDDSEITAMATRSRAERKARQAEQRAMGIVRLENWLRHIAFGDCDARVYARRALMGDFAPEPVPPEPDDLHGTAHDLDA